MDYKISKFLMYTKCFKKFLAFSLIELMISLITISCIVAAFMPVISKKLSSSNVTISGNNVSDITTECSDKFSSNCKLCTKSYCIQCELNSCSTGTYTENKSCSCKDCSNLFSNCIECDSTKCTKCKDNNYYIKNNKCESCPTNKICDGINAYDESYCTNPPTGYYCDGNNIKRCSDKYSMYCATCNSSKCLSCVVGYYLSNNTCNYCGDGCDYCVNSSQCSVCSKGILMDSNNKCTIFCSSVISNCELCPNATKCTECLGGYYVNSNNKCSPCTDIANCALCTDGSTCTMCKAGYYLNYSNKCAECNILNCLSCDRDGTCLSCNQGFHQSDDKKSCLQNQTNFDCSDSNFMRIGNLCITRKNMGDSSMLPIPSSVNIATAGSDYCYSNSQRCCWKGKTSDYCDLSNGGYSGCTRTVCNWEAAKEICSKFNYAGKTWRLATLLESENWVMNSKGSGVNGLMLCDYASGYQSDRCPSMPYCNGAYNSQCAPWAVWGVEETDSTAYTRNTSAGRNFRGGCTKNCACSVRCVTEIE